MTTETPSTTTAAGTRILIQVTEKTITTFTLTPEQLAEYDLPLTLSELTALDEDEADSLSVTLKDAGDDYLSSFEVTERETVFAGVEGTGEDALSAA